MIVAEIGRPRPSIGGTPGDSLCAATRDRIAETAIAQPVPDAQVPAYVADLLRRGAWADCSSCMSADPIRWSGSLPYASVYEKGRTVVGRTPRS